MVELADLYNVDVREILDGESKNTVDRKEVKEVASKMVDYAGNEQSKLLFWIRSISLIGVLLMTSLLALQTFTYEPGIVSFAGYILSLLAFITMTVLALYTNGLLGKLTKNQKLITACKISVIALSLTVLFFILRIMFVFFIVLFAELSPPVRFEGTENYNKAYYLSTYSGDLDTGMFIFPDSTDKMLNSTFKSTLKTGLFDTDGYIILQAEYTEADYLEELERISALECSITFNGETVTQQIQYDEDSYALPAYVTIDGYDNVYEYALVDEESHTITYMLISYPNLIALAPYSDYIKTDTSEYNITDVLNKFTIYAHTFDGGTSWMEYSDMMNQQ